MELLFVLPGVGIPVASAILALSEPSLFAVVDVVNWQALYGEERRSFTAHQYFEYLGDIRKIVADLGCDPQEADQAVWAYWMDQHWGRLPGTDS